MAVAQDRSAPRPESAAAGGAKGNGSSRPRKALTIGAVAKILGQEFDDISISKIRYLEDQKLLSPRRTQGGYRLYSQADVERLRTILRMQRDEFLPLRVIRQELATGDFTGRRPSAEGTQRRAASVDAPVSMLSLADLIDEAGVDERFVRELQEYGIIQADRSAQAAYDETDLEIVRAAAELSRFGVGGRNLRVFRTSADREAALLEQIVGPTLRSRSQARRKEAIENLESLAGICGHLKHLLLVRDLRRIKGE
ncbi:MAG TPA: MerR family transcriptional regulator [Solirubrobacterales bacterium]|nr:MerR family transcriptional regulator [Solirubrobacterales bacterium]